MIVPLQSLDIVYLDSSRSERPQSGPKDMGLKRALDNQNENGLELLLVIENVVELRGTWYAV